MDPNGPIVVVRIKDRISSPLESGYRDVLLNLRIKDIGCDMIMELQLHLRDIIKLVRCPRLALLYAESRR